MAKTSYYVAVSLDGFIAREDGTVDWLSNYTEPLETPYDYEPFYQTVSAVVMGRKTYDTVISFGEYTYKGKPGLVLSKNAYLQINEPGVRFIRLEREIRRT
jgi:dihydrofolate reductase